MDTVSGRRFVTDNQLIAPAVLESAIRIDADTAFSHLKTDGIAVELSR